jgi:hypothetical protein
MFYLNKQNGRKKFMKIKLIVETSILMKLKEKSEALSLKVYEQTTIDSKRSGIILGIQKPADLYELGYLIGNDNITVGHVE